MPTFSFFLWPTGTVGAHDDFAAQLWRLTLQGDSLDVAMDDEAADEASARALAEPYVTRFAASLGRSHLRLLNYEEFGNLPPAYFTDGWSGHVERERLARATREARNHALAADPKADGLMRCYSYLQNATERERYGEGKYVLPELYKGYEVLRDAVGTNEATFCTLLGVEHSRVKRFTRLANEDVSDERHAPSAGQTPSPPTQGDRGFAPSLLRELAQRYAKLA